MNHLIEALVKKLEGEVAIARANIKVYTSNAAGIGEHPDIVEAIETQIQKIADAEEKISVCKDHFGSGNEVRHPTNRSA